MSLPFIHRSTRKGPPAYDDDRDTFVFDPGRELVKVAEGADAKGSYKEFHCQIEDESSLRFRYYPGDKTWRIWNKSGVRSDLAGYSQDLVSGQYFSWRLSRVTDPDGNYMDVQAADLGSGPASPVFLPGRIQYTGHGP